MSDPHFLIVDDHGLYRAGLAMALAQAWPGCAVRQADTLAEGRAALHQLCASTTPQQPALVLLDVRLPDGNALDELQTWQELAQGRPIVLMSSDVDAERLRQVRARGVAGFLHKSASIGDVVASVRTALSGEPAFGTMPYDVLTQGGRTVTAQAVHDAARPFAPSPLQARILQMLGRGTPNRAIARQVGLNEMQVRAEVSWLTEALGASSREEAYRKAMDLGWVSA